MRTNTQPLSALFRESKVARCTGMLWLYALVVLIVSMVEGRGATLWKENFESASADVNWAPTRGNWQIGTPTNTKGPAQAHSGSRCAAVGLRTNYLNNVSSSLAYFRQLQIPDKLRKPTLRFWHWFSIDLTDPCFQGSADYGQVKVQLANGTEEAISPQYNGASDWSPAALDLTKYAGQTVQIGFYFFSNCATAAAGWFVDDVELVADQYPFMGFESFECGWETWSATRGNWQVGSPQNGPGKAWSGANCAGIVIKGSYPNNGSSSLSSPPIMVPSASQRPRLRFMHWFSIDLTDPCFQGSADYGQVKVRLANGTEEAISPQYNGASDWSPAALDLAKYAGQTVQIEFYFFSNCATATAGWFVDDVELRTGDSLFLARLESGDQIFATTEGFEQGWGDWSTTRGNWQVGKPINGPGRAASGTNCAGIVLRGNYPNNVSSSLLSPPFLVPGTNQNPRLRFMHWFSIDLTDPCFQGSADYGQVKVRLANGTEEPISLQYNGASDWTPASLDLTKYAGQTVQIEFYFFSNCATPAAGWFVDDVQILPSVPNAPPGFTAIKGQIARAGTLLTFQIAAFDPNAGQSITYSLDTNTAPAGASIEQVTGVFSWTPNEDQIQTNGYYVVVRATDNGQPQLSSSSVVPIITVNGQHLIPSLEEGGSFHIAIPDTISGFDYVLEASSDFVGWQSAVSFAATNRGEPQCYQTMPSPTSPYLFYRLKAAPSQP